jgi:hypothetical protein
MLRDALYLLHCTMLYASTDQLVWGPIWNSTYVCLVGLMKRDSPKRVYEAVTTTMVPLVVSGLKLWPAVHLVTVSG